MHSFFYRGKLYVGHLIGIRKSVNDIYGHTQGQTILLISSSDREKIDKIYELIVTYLSTGNDIYEEKILKEIGDKNVC